MRLYMSHKLVEDTTQPKAGAFASIPSDKEIAADLKESATSESENTSESTTDNTSEGGDGYQLPDKFKDKSATEIAESYANLEQELGRKAQEVGNLRTLTDQLLELRPTVSERQPAVSQETPELTADDVLNDPRTAIQGVVREETGAVNTRIDQLEAQLSLDAFASRHPTFVADQTDPAFTAFVQGSNYKQQLAQKAAGGDISAAEELWSAWDEDKPGETEPVKEPTAAEKEALDSAAAIAQRGGGESTEQGPKPISRHDLAIVKIEDEARYYSEPFQAYIQKMYAAKLVK